MTEKFSPSIKVIKAIKKIIRFAENNKLGANVNGICTYHDAEKNIYCAIGCLLPKKTLALVKMRGFNAGTHISALYRLIPGLEKEIGLTRNQAHDIQRWHDSWAGDHISKQEFINRLQLIVNGTESVEYWLEGTS